MDPLSISASVAGLLTLADLAFRKTIKYSKDVKDAPTILSRLSVELRTLCMTLHGLTLLVEELELKSNPLTITSDHVNGCRDVLNQIAEKVKDLEVYHSSKAKRIAKRLKAPFEIPEIEKSLDQIQRFIAIFNNALQAKSIPLLIELLDGQASSASDLKAIKDEVFRQRDVEMRIAVSKSREKVLSYFTLAAIKTDHKAILRARHPGTGQWLLKDDMYQNWKSCSPPNLWLSGIPGAGKTVLAATMIQDVLESCASNEAVAYFYCDYKDAARQDPINILGSIASQLATQHEKCFDLIQKYYDELHLNDQHPSKPDADHLISLIRNAARVFGLASIIVDGIDECGQNTSSVVKSLIEIGQNGSNSVRIALLSRDEQEIQRQLIKAGYAQMSVIAHREDISLYVAAEIVTRKQEGKLRLKSQTLESLILEQLVNEAKGMFRWVVCQMDYLCRLPNDNERRKALGSLPPTLDETYERILYKVMEQEESVQELVRSALRWILFSKEILSTSDLCEAVSISHHDTELNADNLIDQDEILIYCSSFVRLTADAAAIEMAHFTVREFFTNDRLKRHSSLGGFYMDEGLAFPVMGIQCLLYLNLKNFENKIVIDEKESKTHQLEFPFHTHAAVFWNQYIKDDWTDETVTGLIRKLFAPDPSKNFLLWCHMFWTYFVGLESLAAKINQVKTVTLGYSTLAYASMLGIPELVDWLLSEGLDVNRSGHLGTTIHWAIAGEYAMREFALSSTLPQWRDLNFDICSTWGPRRKAVIMSLLAANADCSRPLPYGKNINISASELCLHTGDFEIFNQLVSRGSLIDKPSLLRLQNTFMSAPDHMHIDAGVSKILQEVDVRAFAPDCHHDLSRLRSFLRMHETSLNDDGKEKLSNIASTIQFAIQHDQVAELQRILNEGSWNVHEVNEKTGETCLHIAASSGSTRCMKLLLDNGGQPTVLDKLGRSALLVTAKATDPTCASILLDLGMDPWLKDSEGCNLLLLAARGGSVELLKLLSSRYELEFKKEANATDNLGRTPLLTAALMGADDALLYLLPYSDTIIQTHQGVPLAHIAAGVCLPTTLETLEKTGADMLAVADDGSNLLHFLARNPSCSEEYLRKTLSRISPTLRREDGRTPLHILFSQGSKRCVDVFWRTLVSRETINLVDNAGLSPLHHLMRSRGTMKNSTLRIDRQLLEYIDFLLENGADPSIRCCEGVSCFDMFLNGLVPPFLPYDFGPAPNSVNGRIIAYFTQSLSSRKSVSARLNQTGDLAYDDFCSIASQDPHSRKFLLVFEKVIDCLTDKQDLDREFLGYRPLSLALPYSELATKFMSAGADPALCSSVGRKRSALDVACRHGCSNEVFAKLVSSTTAVTQRNSIQDLPLHTLCSNRDTQYEFVQLLCDAGADPNARGAHGALAFELAVSLQKTNTAKLLIERGASVVLRQNEDSTDSLTGLHIVVQRNNLGILQKIHQLLIGADWNLMTFQNSDFYNILHIAAANHAIACAEFILSKKLLEVDSRTQNGCTALHVASIYQDLDMINWLIINGADRDAADVSGNTALHYTAMYGAWSTAKHLLDISCAQTVTLGGETPAMLARRRKFLGFVEQLKKYNQTSSDSNTPEINSIKTIDKEKSLPLRTDSLLEVIWENDLASFEALMLNNGLNPDLRIKGHSILIRALLAKNPLIVQWLIDQECDLTELWTVAQVSACPGGEDILEGGWSGYHLNLLHLTVTDRELSEKLLESILDHLHPDTWRTAEFSPLYLAILLDNVFALKCLLDFSLKWVRKSSQSLPVGRDGSDLFQWLLEWGPPIYEHDRSHPYRNLPLHIAAEKGNENIARILLEYGAHVNSLDSLLQTPLHVAVCKKSQSMITLLLEHGANPNAIDDLGRSVLMMAAKYGDEATIRSLIEYHAEINTKDAEGLSALSYGSTGTICIALRSLGCGVRPPLSPKFDNELDRSLFEVDDTFDDYVLGSGVQISRAVLWKYWAYKPKSLLKTIRLIFQFCCEQQSEYEDAQILALDRTTCTGDSKTLKFLLSSPVYAYAGARVSVQALLTACSSGRIEFVKILLRHQNHNRWLDVNTISAAYIAARNHKDVRSWLTIGRFMDFRMLEAASAQHSNTSGVQSWSGVWTMSVPIFGRYKHQENMSSFEYLLEMRRTNKQRLLVSAYHRIDKGGSEYQHRTDVALDHGEIEKRSSWQTESTSGRYTYCKEQKSQSDTSLITINKC